MRLKDRTLEAQPVCPAHERKEQTQQRERNKGTRNNNKRYQGNTATVNPPAGQPSPPSIASCTRQCYGDSPLQKIYTPSSCNVYFQGIE